MRYEQKVCYHGPYRRRRYGLGRLLLDFILVLITNGLWLIWIFIRFLRSNTR